MTTTSVTRIHDRDERVIHIEELLGLQEQELAEYFPGADRWVVTNSDGTKWSPRPENIDRSDPTDGEPTEEEEWKAWAEYAERRSESYSDYDPFDRY